VLPRPPRRHEINWKAIAMVAGIAVLLAVVATVALRPRHAIGTAVEPPSATQLEDRRILDEVNRVLDSSSALREQEVGIRVEKGVVYLDGRVDSKEESDIAENLTYSVVGVNGIKNNLTVGGGAKKPAARPSATANPPASAEPAGQKTPATESSTADSASQQRRITALLTQAQRQSDMGHYVVARDLYLAVLSMDPNNAQADEGRKYAHRMIVQQRQGR
jgi:hypothetical protein